MTNSAEVAAFVAAIETRLGRIDVCVTNSGGPPSKSFRETKPEEWRAAVDQLLMSTVFFARETLPRMQKNKWGRLITITSSAVKQPVDGLLLSNSVRAAVTGLARTLANEYAAAVAFLASERASFVNGTSVAVDGGLVRSLL